MTINSPLQENGTGDVFALALMQFSGETIAAFNQTQVTRGRHIEKTIKNGRSSQFPVFGRSTARYFTPGTDGELTGGSVRKGERVITIDGLLLSHEEMSEIEEMMAHYDTRSEYALQMGAELANVCDTNTLRKGILGARQAAADGGSGPILTGPNDPNPQERIVDANVANSDTNLIAAISDASVQMTNEKVPKANRTFYTDPVAYSLLTRSQLALNKDLGGVGSFSAGTVGPVQGIEIVETVNFPNADDSANAALKAGYRADFSNTVGLMSHRSAIGTLKLMSLQTEEQYDVRHQTSILVAKMATGHDWLRAEANVEVATL